MAPPIGALDIPRRPRRQDQGEVRGSGLVSRARFGGPPPFAIGPAGLDPVRTADARDRRTCKAWHTIVSSPSGEPGLVSVREVADQLGVHPETIRRLIHDGRL